ncbi:MAG: photosystem II stability/assembly factor-like uncharacterized protein [Ulvibacter sp.]|jgi:photosystem II stability/assembly factor-like uncharacterized protein
MKKAILSFACLFISILTLAQSSWQQLPNAPTSVGRFDDIFFLNEDLGWGATGGGYVFKTTDGGDTWEQKLSLGNSYFRNIEFIDENVGFLGTLDGVFYRTNDGGDSWLPVTISPNPPAICGLDAVGTSVVYGVGSFFSPAYYIKSTDGGTNWSYVDMSMYAEALVEVLFIDELHGFMSGSGYTGGVILETFDGGSTWDEIFNSGNYGDYVWKIQLRDNNTHMFCSVQSNNDGKLIRSFDSGASWIVTSAPEDYVQAVGFISDTHGWMGGHNTGFYETIDGGLTWTDMNLGASLNRFFFFNDNFAYCSGQSVYKYDGALSVGEFEENPQNDLEIVIAPQPIKDKLNIKISYAHTDNLLLGLYDITGRFVKRLIRDQIPNKGEKQYIFDFDYPSGTYVLDFHTNNGRRGYTIVKE